MKDRIHTCVPACTYTCTHSHGSNSINRQFAINRFHTGTTVKQESLWYRPQGELCVYFRPVTSTTTTVDTLLHQQAALYRPLQLHKMVSTVVKWQNPQDGRCMRHRSQIWNIPPHTHTYAHTHIHTHIRTYTHIHTHTHTYTHIHTHTHTYTHTHTTNTF